MFWMKLLYLLCPSRCWGGIMFYPCPSVCMSVLPYAQSCLPFSNLKLPEPSAMKPIHNAYYHKKIQIKSDFCEFHLSCFRVMPLYKGFFSFPFSYLSLPLSNVMKLIHNYYYHLTQIKYKFEWCHYYGFSVMFL